MNATKAPRFGILVCIAVAIVLIVPVIFMVPMSFTSGSTITFPPVGFSFRWYSEVFTSPVWTSRIAVSLQAALGTTVLATGLGTLAAFALVRGTFRGKSLLWALVLAPLVVPVVVLGAGEFFILAQGWRIGSFTFGGGLIGTIPGLILAHSVLALPYPAILVATSLATVDRDLELAAGSLGASPIAAFRTVTLPLIVPGVLAGAVFSFLTSWDEVVMSTFITSSRVNTVPVEIFTDLREQLNPTAAAVSTLLLFVSLVLFVLLGLFQRYKRGATPPVDAENLTPAGAAGGHL